MKMIASSRLHSIRLLIVLLCLSLALPFATLAQTNAPTPLPPAAQEALDKGIIAAKIPDYLLAIRYFEEARKSAPQAPVVYLNMGLAESRIPGRELRAIAWFGAYLAAYPDAPNAAAVKEQIGVLEVKNYSNVSRLIKTLEDAVTGTERERVFNFSEVIIRLWASIGDFASALQSADSYQDPYYKNWVQRDVAVWQAKTGDLAGARQTFAVALQTLDLIKDTKERQSALHQFASTQAKAGDIAGAIQTADRVTDPSLRYSPQSDIAMAQAEIGDSAGARQTLAALRETADRAGYPWKDYYNKHVNEVEARINAGNASRSNVQSEAFALSAISVIAVSDWLNKLNDDNNNNDCPLKSRLFLDLAGYLKSLPQVDNPVSKLGLLDETVSKIVKAQNVIHQMLNKGPGNDQARDLLGKPARH